MDPIFFVHILHFEWKFGEPVPIRQTFFESVPIRPLVWRIGTDRYRFPDKVVYWETHKTEFTLPLLVILAETPSLWPQKYRYPPRVRSLLPESDRAHAPFHKVPHFPLNFLLYCIDFTCENLTINLGRSFGNLQISCVQLFHKTFSLLF